MTIKEITEIESVNIDKIYLYKEGLFWKAYNNSAWLFTKNICSYKINVRKYKMLTNYVVSLGFPANTANKILAGVTVIDRNNNLLILKSEVEFNCEDYDTWFTQCCIGYLCSDREKSLYEHLFTGINNFPLEQSTPLQCMNFVSELKEIINQKTI